MRERKLALRQTPPLADTWPELRPPLGDEALLLFAGDSHFEGRLSHEIRRDGEEMLDSLAPLFAQGDVGFLNLETAIAEEAGAAGDKEFHFRAPPVALAALRRAGVDVVSMANNHTLDCGDAGLRETLSAAQASEVAVIGIGATAADAFAPALVEVRGLRIATIAATQSLDRDWMWRDWTASDSRGGVASAREVGRLVAAVRDARAAADIVVVFLHWGENAQARACAAQRKLAPELVAAGAQAVVGASSHRVNSAGMLGSSLVCYGLGNFLWWRDGPAPVLAVWVAGGEVREFQWVPGYRVDGIPRPMGAAESEAYRGYAARNVARDGLVGAPSAGR